MRYALEILQSAGSTEPSSFNELLQAMGPDAPERDNKGDWRDFFLAVDRLKHLKLIEVGRIAGKIDSVMVTPEGVAMIPRLKKMQPGQGQLQM
jgi:hypothetical protein